jgi:hypothetical protein
MRNIRTGNISGSSTLNDVIEIRCTKWGCCSGGRFPVTSSYCSFAYSARASFKMGTSGSEFFQRAKKLRYSDRLLSRSSALA